MAILPDRTDELKVETLRRLLNAEEPLPLGMRSRIEARLAAELREGGRPGLAFPTLLGLTLFIGGSGLNGLRFQSAAVLVVLTLCSIAYGAWLAHLVARAGSGQGSVGGEIGDPLTEE